MQSLFNGYPLSEFLSNRYAELQKHIDALTIATIERGLSVLLEEIKNKLFLQVPLLNHQPEIAYSSRNKPMRSHPNKTNNIKTAIAYLQSSEFITLQYELAAA